MCTTVKVQTEMGSVANGCFVVVVISSSGGVGDCSTPLDALRSCFKSWSSFDRL